MAKFSIATNDALTQKLWEEKLIRETQQEEFFSGMKGGMDSIVWEKNELEKKKGDTVTFGFSDQLVGEGRSGAQTLEGYEERVATYAETVTIDLHRHAVRDEGELDRQRPVFNVTEEQRALLKDWGVRKQENMKFDALAEDATQVIYNLSDTLTVAASEAAAKSALHATNSKITMKFLSQARRYLLSGGSTGGGISGRAFEPFKPVLIKGKKYVVLLTNQEVAYDMQVNSDFSNAWKDARERGIDNPLFNMADLIWDGVIVISNEKLSRFDNGGGGSVHGTRGVFLGAGALCWAWGKRVSMVDKTFDYDDEIGTALKFMAGVKKPQKNSLDYGSAAVYFACTKIG